MVLTRRYDPRDLKAKQHGSKRERKLMREDSARKEQSRAQKTSWRLAFFHSDFTYHLYLQSLLHE